MAQSFRFSRMTRLAAMFFLSIPFATGCIPSDGQGATSSGNSSSSSSSGSGGGAGGGGDVGGGGGGADGGVITTIPTVISNRPLMGATDVLVNDYATVTFSEAMDGAKLNTMTFTLKADAVAIPGTVTYANSTAFFWPTEHLASDTKFTATVTVDAVSVFGVPLAEEHVWTFTTGKIIGYGQPVDLGTASNYVILAKTAISTVPKSTITGDVGISPAAASYITGFSLVADATNVFSTSAQITGKVYAANFEPPTPSNLTTAIGDMELAFTAAAGRSPDVIELGAGNIGGMLLPPGVYKWGSGLLIPTNITLEGTAKDVWIFQIAQDLIVADTVKVNLTGGALPENVFWQVAGFAELGITSHFEGVLLTQTSVTLNKGASVFGRLFAQTAVNLSGNTIIQPSL